MFCCVVKIVYIFITIFFSCCSSLFYFLYALFFFLDWEERAHFYGKPLMMSSKDNENVRVQWRMRTHAQPEERRASSTNASVELENMPVLWLANASGGEGTQREQLAQVFISAFWSIHPAPLLHYTVVAVPGQHLVVLQRTQPHWAETKASLHEQSFLFLFWVGGAKFLCPNDYWADFFLPSKSLFAPEPLRHAQNVGIVCFPLPVPPALYFFLLSFTLYFMLLQWA